MRSIPLSVFITVLAFVAAMPGAQQSPSDVEWRYYSGDNGARMSVHSSE